MDKIIAYCGLICSDCSAYIATQANDQAALEAVAAQWRKDWNAPEISEVSVICDDCLGRLNKCSFCTECDIRAYGIWHKAWCRQLNALHRLSLCEAREYL